MKEVKPLKKEKEGIIGIYYLKEIWQYFNDSSLSKSIGPKVEWKYINSVFNALGLGLEPTIQYLMSSTPGFNEFEHWIEKNGKISKELINHFNSIIDSPNKKHLQPEKKVLIKSDLEKWDKEGYLILKEVIPKEDCERTVNLIYESIGANPSVPETWYKQHPLKNGIMIQLFNPPILDKNRLSKNIRSAYQQLWKRNDLMVSMDRVSFNPPVTASFHFPGPNLHWDVSLKSPIPFGLQGLLYLSDTNEDQGAFSLIPGFHNEIEDWLAQLEEGVNPRDKNLLNDFEVKPIAGKAGDFIIWNQCLPHGSSPNKSNKPRIVQYINYQPLDLELQEEWI